jgi:membrane associated rhomboid family serine protease
MLSDRDYYRGTPRRPSLNDGPIIKPLIILNIIVFLICIMTERFMDNGGLLPFIALRGYEVAHGQIWRLATYMFAHGGFFHIFFNMWGLFIFGILVEHAIGSRHTLYIYLTSGLLGGLVWMAANLRSPFPMVGASGALYGVMVAAAVIFPNVPMQLLFPPVTLKLRTMVIAYIIIDIICTFDPHGYRIAYLAHLGGALGGYVYMQFLLRKLGRPTIVTTIQSYFRRRAFKRKLNADGSYTAEDLNRILQKLSQVGYDHLTPQEKSILSDASQKLKDRRQ